MKHRLQDDSVRVINGELYSPDGKLLYDPSLLVIGDVLLKAGNYDDMHKSLLSVYSDLVEKGLDTKDVFLICLTDYIDEIFTVYDVCYVIRRGVEFTGVGFIKKFMEMYKRVDFPDWLKNEKSCFSIEVEE